MSTPLDKKKPHVHVVGSGKSRYEQLKQEMMAGDVLQDARLKSGLTQSQVAARMGTTAAAVAKLEASLMGKPSPTIATLRKYAAALGKKLEIRLV